MKTNKSIKTEATKKEFKSVFDNYNLPPRDIYAYCSDGTWVKCYNIDKLTLKTYGKRFCDLELVLQNIILNGYEPDKIIKQVESKTMKYHVVRLNYGVVDSRGHYHQTDHFSRHIKLSAAIKSFLKMQKKYNCVDIVDDDGKKINFYY